MATLSRKRLEEAIRLHNAGQIDQALQIYHSLLAQHPHVADLLQLVGAASLQLGDCQKSLRYLKAALRADPNHVESLATLGVVHRINGHFRYAAEAFLAAARLAPTQARHHINLGKVYLDLTLGDEAIAAFTDAIAADPENAEAHYFLGGALKMMGNMDDAASALRQAVDMNPNHVDAWRQLADLDVTTAADAEVLEAKLASGSSDPAMEAKTSFAIYRTLERLGDRKRAFSFLVRGNRTKRSLLDYDVGADEDKMVEIARIFTQDRCRKVPSHAWKGPRTVYIVGMNRSGTTLVEQILSSHSQVVACGELNIVGRIASEVGRQRGVPFPRSITSWKDRDIREMAVSWLQRDFNDRAPGAAVVTDKEPNNFRYVGLIRMMIPDAIFIQCHRNAMDCCFANYRVLFASGNGFAYSWPELLRYYRACEALMAHWSAVCPDNQVLDVRYEDVVDDLEGQARRIIAHCGLSWEDACLNFHAKRRVVKTPSATQVRQPIYRTAVGRWRGYEDDIRALLAEDGIDPDAPFDFGTINRGRRDAGRTDYRGATGPQDNLTGIRVRR